MGHDGNFAVEEMPAQQLRLKTLRENPQLPGSKSDHVPPVSVTPLASVAADSETEPEGVDAVELEADRKLRAQDRIVFETVPQVGTCRLASSPKCSRVGPKVRTPAVERREVRTCLDLRLVSRSAAGSLERVSSRLFFCWIPKVFRHSFSAGLAGCLFPLYLVQRQRSK